MRTLTLLLCAAVIIATGLPLINSSQWWIRIFDFPRLQIAVSILISIFLGVKYLDFKRNVKLPLLLILGVCLIYQLQFVLIYTPLFPTQGKNSDEQSEENSFTLLVFNVLMENEEKGKLLELVKEVNPDILLLTEPDEEWASSIKILDEEYPYSVKYPLDNTYGMILLSKLQLEESEINFLVKDSIPSIFTKVILPSGSKIDFYGVHPEPPKPGTDTYERDTELLIIGKQIKETKNPTVVAGDLNDVGWSGTSKLFRKYSELVDPREGRGLYSTFSAFIPLFRYPLDHIFYSKEFGLLTLQKLGGIGSDHYPILIGLNYEPDEDNTEGLETTDAKEEVEVKETIEEGKEGDNE